MEGEMKGADFTKRLTLILSQENSGWPCWVRDKMGGNRGRRGGETYRCSKAGREEKGGEGLGYRN